MFRSTADAASVVDHASARESKNLMIARFADFRQTAYDVFDAAAHLLELAGACRFKFCTGRGAIVAAKEV
jgi:hypothetical protein